MSEATRTREAYNATIKGACDTFEIEKCHEEQQKAIDLFFMGKMSLFHCMHWHCQPCTIFIVFIVSPLIQSCDRPARLQSHENVYSLPLCHSLFGHSTFFVVSLEFMKGTSFCVIGRNVKKS